MNFLTLMGYSMPDEKEIYSLDEIIEAFDPKRIGTSGAFFDIQKLGWVNQRKLIESIPEDQLWNRLQNWSFNETFMRKLMPLAHTRIRTFGDFMDLCDFFFVNDLKITPELLIPKQATPEMTASVYQAMIWSLDEQEDWTGKGMEKGSHEIAEIFGVHHKKMVIQPLFAAIMGKHQGPPLFDSVTLLGKDRTRVRLMQAIEALGGISNKKMDALKKGWEKRDCKALFTQQPG